MKIGIIGLGRAGAAHVQAYRAHGIAIGAVAGSTYERTAQRAAALGLSVAVCPSVEALLARDDIHPRFHLQPSRMALCACDGQCTSW